MSEKNYYNLYLKYKSKYLDLKGGERCVKNVYVKGKVSDIKYDCYKTAFGDLDKNNDKNIAVIEKIIERCKEKNIKCEDESVIVTQYEEMKLEEYNKQFQIYKTQYDIIIKKLTEANKRWIAYVTQEVDNNNKKVEECKKKNWATGSFTCNKTFKEIIEANKKQKKKDGTRDTNYYKINEEYEIKKKDFFTNLNSKLDNELNLEKNNVKIKAGLFKDFLPMIGENIINSTEPFAALLSRDYNLPFDPTNKTSLDIIGTNGTKNINDIKKFERSYDEYIDKTSFP